MREEIMAEADNRVRAVERAAAEATGRAEAQAAAAITALEARLREAEAARSEALSRADARVAAAEQAAAAQSASSASMMASLQVRLRQRRRAGPVVWFRVRLPFADVSSPHLNPSFYYQEEMSKVRSLLDTAEADLRALKVRACRLTGPRAVALPRPLGFTWLLSTHQMH